ncbi:condensation domain-containing protein, partial [Caldalkalibacillus mannanilyticus]|uniref:condensation domain-containing protein n=1 Tax=Caldalkalibacillus mannanilyticus TaxID=1418 RepID=UPI0011DDD360
MRIPIGQPLPNLQIMIVDQYHKLAPIGVKGEIWVSGIGVGEGYWKNAELTSAKFIPNPFTAEAPYSRVYRTGDLGRWMPDGTVEFFGRMDFQVKVRGFRIELGEIESALNTHPKIDEAVVIIKKSADGENTLIAFYTSKQELKGDELQHYLRDMLPYYMIPTTCVCIEKMPLLTSEKIDRHALQALKVEEGGNREAILPSTQVEEHIATIWSEVLDLEHVYVDDNFFRIGGHSISAVKVINRIRERYQIKMALQQIFITPVLSELASVIENEVAKTENEMVNNTQHIVDRPIVRVPRKEYYKLAPVQLPEWYLHYLEPENPFYNVSFDVMFHGDMNVEAFEWAWQVLVQRHSILRACFTDDNGTPLLRIKPEMGLSISAIYENYTHIPAEQIQKVTQELAYAHANQVFDFENGPLFYTKLIEFPHKQFLFMFVSHHIIWDETSSMNLMKEFNELYNAYVTKREPDLPALEV